MRRVKALFGLFLETPPDDAIERGGDAGGDLRELRRVFLEDRVHRFHLGVALEGATSRQHLVEDRAERKDVGPVIDRLSSHLLG